MRKIQFYLLVICLFVVMTGCVNNDYEEREKTPDSQQAVEERNEDFNNVKGNVVIDNELSDSGEENIAFPNPYFYNQNYTILKAEYYEHWGDLSNETVDMQISFVKPYEQGNVYKFTIDLLPDLFPSYFSGENMNIYFYVTEDKIYRLRPYVQPQPNGETYYFYDDDELLTQMLNTDEKVMNNGEIVCQEEETDEEYSSIKVNGNQITYSRHETKPNGEDGYKEIFVWEKGKGLLEYRVGFGSQPYAVYLGEILEVESAESRQSESEAIQSPDETVEQDYMTESYDAGEGVFMSEYMKEMDTEFQETVIEEGILYEREVVYAQSDKGLLSMGDAALDSQIIGDFLINVMENRDVEKYRGIFGGEQYFDEFRGLMWNQLDTGWIANRYYDCCYTYVTEKEGYVSFTYYIYPDYEQMQVETSKVVIFRCDVDTGDGLICGTEFRAYDMTVEEYQTVREWKGKRIAVIEDGKVAGGGGLLTIPGQDSEEDVKYIDTMADMGSDSLVKLFMEDLRTGNIANGEVSNFLIDKESTWLSDIADEIHENTDGWELEETYDFYYLNHNEQAGLIHYKYYYYWNKLDEKNEKVLVTDAWISEDGIRDMQIHWFLTRRHIEEEEGTDSEIIGQNEEKLDIEAFLTIDWTDEDIIWVWNHTVSPDDSGQGWKFAVADIDFDGSQELLVIFPSNHCGGNSLYIYKQEDGNAFSYIDTIATTEQDMRSGIDYKAISLYMDIDLLDAYVNKDEEYRYLSMDRSTFGGDIHGGYDTVVLYETVLDENVAPKEVCRIEYYAPEEREELYFLGEKVYETGRLRDMIASYMDGYREVEIDYRMAEKTFARDVIGLDEAERNDELQELYESLKALADFTYAY
ncbi:MAG: hypothetical protein ACI4C4_13970 [Lachnospiraceae bacterium]